MGDEDLTTAGWTATPDGLVARFHTGTMVRGLEFVSRVVGAAEAANHHPDIDFRYGSVALTLITHDAGDEITDLDHRLAREITNIAASLDVSS
jgi:4a-hydroxytetrahydrobiopterin dehydratase